MTTFTDSEDGRSTLYEIGEEAQRALRGRPRVSIRTRLGVGFVVWFILSLTIAIISMVTISRVQKRLNFMEAADRYTYEIQQARRFEKNYFLYRTNLEDALEHVRIAGRILIRESENVVGIVGKEEFASMSNRLKRYEGLLLELKNSNASPDRHDVIEKKLREHGAEMVTLAEGLVAKERATVQDLLALSQRIPLVFIVLIALSILALIFFIANQMLAPLKRMVGDARRIADGDLTPITPRRKYHDEFSSMAVALNHMMLQLVRRQELLVQAHKLQAVGTLTAGVAHELNNPINNIMLTAAMLHEDYTDLPDDERLDMVNDLVKESERAQKIVRNLLDFARESRIESEKHEVQGIIDDTLRLATNRIKLTKVKVKGELDSNLAPIFGDRRQLEQVFLNMVLNALDSMPEGGTLTIACDNTRDRDFVVVKFSDTGVGIPEEKTSEIFQPFYTTKPGVKGTGLGLSVSLGIIKQHGGDIKVTSKVGEGTTFSVFLPVARVPAAIPDDDDSADLPIERDGDTESIQKAHH